MLTGAPLPFGLRDTQLERYARHLILPEIGGRGQRMLLDSAVALRGCGRSAEEALAYLAAAGVGSLSIDREAPATWEARLSDLNPDVSLTRGHAPEASLCVDAPGHRRLDGALAALQLLCHLLGVRDRDTWSLALPELPANPQAPAETDAPPSPSEVP